MSGCFPVLMGWSSIKQWISVLLKDTTQWLQWAQSNTILTEPLHNDDDLHAGYFFTSFLWSFPKNFFRNTIRVSTNLDPDQDGHSVGTDLGPNCLQRLLADEKVTAGRQRAKQREQSRASWMESLVWNCVFVFFAKAWHYQVPSQWKQWANLSLPVYSASYYTANTCHRKYFIDLKIEKK